MSDVSFPHYCKTSLKGQEVNAAEDEPDTTLTRVLDQEFISVCWMSM